MSRKLSGCWLNVKSFHPQCHRTLWSSDVVLWFRFSLKSVVDLEYRRHNELSWLYSSDGSKELSYILAKLFDKCFKESSFRDCWKVSPVVSVFTNVGERSTAKNYRPVSLLSVVIKVFEKLVNNTIDYHPEKSCLFSNFQYGFRPSRLTADLLTVVVSDRFTRAFNRSGATQAVALHISKAFDRVWHAGLLH